MVARQVEDGFATHAADNQWMDEEVIELTLPFSTHYGHWLAEGVTKFAAQPLLHLCSEAKCTGSCFRSSTLCGSVAHLALAPSCCIRLSGGSALFCLTA